MCARSSRGTPLGMPEHVGPPRPMAPPRPLGSPPTLGTRASDGVAAPRAAARTCAVAPAQQIAVAHWVADACGVAEAHGVAGIHAVAIATGWVHGAATAQWGSSQPRRPPEPMGRRKLRSSWRRRSLHGVAKAHGLAHDFAGAHGVPGAHGVAQAHGVAVARRRSRTPKRGKGVAEVRKADATNGVFGARWGCRNQCTRRRNRCGRRGVAAVTSAGAPKPMRRATWSHASPCRKAFV